MLYENIAYTINSNKKINVYICPKYIFLKEFKGRTSTVQIEELIVLSEMKIILFRKLGTLPSKVRG